MKFTTKGKTTMTMQTSINKTPIRYALVLLVALSAGVALVTYTRRAYAIDQDIQKLNRFMQTAKVNTAAMQVFREGRDMIEAQNWQKAAEKFNDFIKGFPKEKDVDAALYWYGYALQKQNLKDDAAKPLLRLINNYPNSTWRREAEALLVTMGRQQDVTNALNRDNCEIKILALQSLFQADQDRAITYVTEVLKANSTQCPGLPSAAVSLLGSHAGARAVPMLLEIARSNPDLKLRMTAVRRLGEQHTEPIADELAKLYDVDKTKELRMQILRALADSRTTRGTTKLFEVARSGDDPEIRGWAIRYIGQLKDPTAYDELVRIYDADKTPAIRSQVLRALSEREDPRARAKILEIAKTGETPELRIEAIRRLSERGRIAMDDLLSLYTGETNLQIKQGLLRAFGNVDDVRARTKLLEIARGNDPIELRGYAIRQLGNRDDAETVNQLVSLYDGEQNVQVRAALLRAFGDSKQESALLKLMQVAKNDQSVELRKQAVRFLGDSKDPRALKFLEDLLK
jgi:HEAT repeat protein